MLLVQYSISMLKTKVGSLLSKKDRDQAASLVAKGQIAGIFNRGVCALWFDGGNLTAVKKIWAIKGEGRRGKPIALTLSLKELIPMIDLSKLPPDVQKFFSSPDLKSKIGSLCFIRAPLKDSHFRLIPDHAKSFDGGVCMIQNWDSHGHAPTEVFLKKVRQLGVAHPAVTSMNVTGQREIVNQQKGAQFCQDHGIPIFLKDPQAHPFHIGSYTIFTLGRNGIKLERDGNIPGKLFSKIFGLPIDLKNAKKPNYPQLKFPGTIFKNLTGTKVREIILLYLKGGNV